MSAASKMGRQVIALHCSGANGGQWKALAGRLAAGDRLTTPEHFGTGSTGPWPGPAAMTLADEAARTLALIDAADRPVHLVGHSYGGAVALHATLARPHRIASLALYEPCAFHLLRLMGRRGAPGLAEIEQVSGRVEVLVAAGQTAHAAARFVDYWSGAGTWDGLRPKAQAALATWIPDVIPEFLAALGEAAPLAAYARLRVPTLLLRGEHAPASTRAISACLAEQLPACFVDEVLGAGHIGPLTHAEGVASRIVAHLDTASAGERLAA